MNSLDHLGRIAGRNTATGKSSRVTPIEHYEFTVLSDQINQVKSLSRSVLHLCMISFIVNGAAVILLLTR